MRLLSLDRPRLFLVTALLTSSLFLWSASAQDQPNTAKTKSASCSNDDSGLKLPAGFCATVFADGIGHARHMAVASNGVVYVNTWTSEDYGPAKPPAGGFLVALQDKTGTGKADVVERFGETVQSGGAGGGSQGKLSSSL